MTARPALRAVALAFALVLLLDPTRVEARGVPVQVLDLNTSGHGSGIASEIARIGSTAYFAGDEVTNGIELWRTDGTTEGTSLVVDIRPGPGDSSPSCLVAIGSSLYFRADDGVHGHELWTSDGTEEGTRMIADGLPGPASLWPCDFVQAGDLVFFRAFPGSGTELWRSDGTEEGTFPVRQGSVGFLTAVGDEVFFSSTADDTGNELWASDGTPEGTRLVADLRPGQADSSPRSLAAAPEGLVFLASPNGFGSLQRYVSDGTEQGTIPSATPPALCGGMNRVGDHVLFGGVDQGRCGIWRTDGTEAGTELVVDLHDDDGYFDLTGPFTVVWDQIVTPAFVDFDGALVRADPATGEVEELFTSSACGIGIGEVTPLGDALFFSGKTSAEGWELYKSEGTAASTTLFPPLVVPGRRGSAATHLTPLGDKLVFAARDVAHGTEPWVTDGTEAGTFMLRDVNLKTSRGIGQIRSVGGIAYVETTQRPAWQAGSTKNGSIQEPELWQTDGTTAGTVPVPWTDAVDFASLPLATDGTRTYFLGHQPDVEWGLFVTDGIPGHSQRLLDVNLGHLGDEWGRILNGRLFFADPPFVYLSDGTPAGTTRLEGIFTSSAADEVAQLGDVLLFVNHATLWRADGTPFGTVPLRQDLNLHRSPLVVLGDEAFFFADDGSRGIELWATDGTDGGTRLVRHIAPGALDAADEPFQLATWRGAVYFAARDGVSGVELWKTDGTEAGTVLVADLAPGGSSFPESLTPAGHRLFFSADGPLGRELAVTDGTTAGTHLVLDIWPGGDGFPRHLFAVGSDVYFAAEDGEHGLELWFSDGTEEGTHLVSDIHPGPDGAAIRELTPAGSRVVFSANDGATGSELWTTTCGDGVVGPNEECDAGAANGANASCCSRTCRATPDASAGAGSSCGMSIASLRLRARTNPGGDRVLVRGVLARPSAVPADADLRIDVAGANGLHASATWTRSQCRKKARSELCKNPSTGASLKMQTRRSGEATLRVQIDGIDLPESLSGPLTLSFGAVGEAPIDWASVSCRASKRKLTCGDA